MDIIVKKAGIVLDKIYKYRFVLAFIIIVVLVLLDLNGSSIGLWNTFLGKDGNKDVILGKSRGIRSDEYIVNTMMAFSQYENNFGFTSNLLRGSDSTNMFIVYGQPVKDIAILFRIFLLGYLVFSPSRGLSFFWWSRMIALFLATFEFMMLITKKNKKVSFIATMLITFSPTIHWWFAVNYLVEMIVFAETAIVLLDKYLKENLYWKRLIYSLIIMLCAGNYAMSLYPAWLIPITYVFLPSLVWVFYENRKNIKFTKKDIITTVFELLFLVGMIARIFIKSKADISIVTNTVYPGKRVNNGGGYFLDLFINHGNLLFPYFKVFYNTCNPATVIDFGLVTIIIVIYALYKLKIKDFLLYFMCAISIFLGIYSIIGFPTILAKITFLSYTTSKRVKSIIGIINVFILSRTIILLKENCFSKRISILISVLFSVITGCVIGFVYHEQIDLRSVIWLSIFVSIIYFLILQWKDKRLEKLLIIAISFFSIVSVIIVNPLRVGTPVFESELGQKVKQINEEEPGMWMTQDMSGQFLIPFGVQTLNSIHTYPNLELWNKIDRDNKFEEVYNRFAHVNIEITDDSQVNFELIQNDVFKVYANIDALNSIGLKYICTKNDFKDTKNTEKNQLEKIGEAEGFNIYKIVNK